MRTAQNHSIVRVLFCIVLAFLALVIWPLGNSSVMADGTTGQFPEEAPDTVTVDGDGVSPGYSLLDLMITSIETWSLIL